MKFFAQLVKATAEKVFGWKNGRKHNGELIGKKQDKVGRSARYLKELSSITKGEKLPAEWATPEQRIRAALKALAK